MFDTCPTIFMCYIMSLIENLGTQLQQLKPDKEIRRVGTGVHQKTNPKFRPKSLNFIKVQTHFASNNESLLKCIMFHVKIIEITRKVERFFSLVFFIQGFVAVVNICTTVFLLSILSPQTQTDLYTQLTFLLINWLLQVFLPCYYSQRIQSSSAKLSSWMFHNEWICEDEEYWKNMKIFMENVKKPLKISVFGVYDVDLQTFGRIVNAAYSLFAVFKKPISN